MFKDQQVLVTGGTGFLGSALVRALLAEGAQVRVVVRHPQQAHLLPQSGVTLLAGDLAAPYTFQPHMEGLHTVFHTAVSYGNRRNQQRVNVDGTRALANMSARSGVQRFVHISSLAAYGYRYRGQVTEDMLLMPNVEPYSTSKAAAENALRAVSQQTGLPITILRPGGIYGAHSAIWTRGMFRLSQLNPIPFIGQSAGRAPIVHVDDVVALALHAAQQSAAVGEAFNVVHPARTTWRDFISAYARLTHKPRWLGLPPKLIEHLAHLIASVSNADSGLIALGETIRFASEAPEFSMQKAHDLLGWQPQIDLNTGVQRCVPWLKSQGLLR